MYKRLLVVGIVALAVSLGTMRARGAESEKPVSINKGPAKARATIQKTDEDDEKGEAKEKKSEAKQAKKAEAKEGKEEDEDDEKGEAKEKKSDAKQAKKAEAKEGKEEDEDDEKGEATEKKSEAKHAKKSEAKEEDDEKDEGKPAAKPSDKIPGPVQATAKKLIGKGKMLELARESDGTYELDYQVKGVHQAAIITVDGKIEEREITVPASTLPKAVIEAVKKLYPKGKITLAEKSTTKDGTVFELEVTETHGVNVTPEGKVK